jgi:hypothetical protein
VTIDHTRSCARLTPHLCARSSFGRALMLAPFPQRCYAKYNIAIGSHNVSKINDFLPMASLSFKFSPCRATPEAD